VRKEGSQRQTTTFRNNAQRLVRKAPEAGTTEAFRSGDQQHEGSVPEAAPKQTSGEAGLRGAHADAPFGGPHSQRGEDQDLANGDPWVAPGHGAVHWPAQATVNNRARRRRRPATNPSAQRSRNPVVRYRAAARCDTGLNNAGFPEPTTRTPGQQEMRPASDSGFRRSQSKQVSEQSAPLFGDRN